MSGNTKQAYKRKKHAQFPQRLHQAYSAMHLERSFHDRLMASGAKQVTPDEYDLTNISYSEVETRLFPAAPELSNGRLCDDK